MGTSLSGLTPATTFDGLLKVGDNDPLTATLKAISTGDGTDTILSLSNSALKIGGDTEIDSSGLNALIVKRNGSELLRTDGSGLNGALTFTGNLTNKFSLGVNGNDFNIWDGSYLGGGDLRFSILADGKTGIGAQTPTAQLHVKGSGATSATTSLLVQNSAGLDMVKVADDGIATIGTTGQQGEINLKRPQDGLAIGKIQGTNNGLYLTNQDGSNHILIGNSSTRGVSVGDGSASAMGARFGIKGSGATSATTALLVQNSAGTDLLKVTDDGAIDFGVLGLEFSNDGSGGTMSVASDRYIRLATSLSTYSALNAHVFKTLGSGGYSEVMRITGNTDQFVGIGETTPTARLHLKGSGNTNTTTSLLVQNSEGSDVLRIYDNRKLRFDGQFELLYGSAFGIAKTTSSLTLSDYTINNRIYTNSNFKSVLYSDSASGGLVGVNNTAPTAQLHVKGSGNDATTTALLVENSAGTDIFKVNDAGQATASGSMTAGYYIAGNSVYAGNYAQVRSTKMVAATTGVGVNIQTSTTNVTPDASAVLQADSTTQGFLPPRMTDAERDAIATPAAGLMIYDTTNNQMNYWNGSVWIAF